MPTTPGLQTLALPGGETLFYCRALMIVPQGGPVVRQFNFITPIINIDPQPWSDDAPSKTPTIITRLENPDGTHPAMKVYNITVVPDEAFTLTKVSAVSKDGLPLQGDIYCTFIAIGTLATTR